MSIEWKYGDKNNDWQEYFLVSMKFSIRHILFIIFYICVLLAVRSHSFEKGRWAGIHEEAKISKAWRDSDWELLKQKEKDLKDKEASYLEIIEKQRKAFVELEHRFVAEQQLDILEFKLDSGT